MSQVPEVPLDSYEPGFTQLKPSELRSKLSALDMPTTGLQNRTDCTPTQVPMHTD